VELKRTFFGVLFIFSFVYSGWTQMNTELKLNRSLFQSGIKNNNRYYVPSKSRVRRKSMVTNRPGVSESSKAVYKGGFQIESGAQYSYAGNLKNFQFPDIGLLYGVSKRVEVRFFTGYNFSTYTDHMNFLIGTKVNVMKQKKGLPELAFIFNQSLPRLMITKVSTDQVVKYWRSNFIAAWSYSFPKNISIAGNLKYVLRTGGLDGNTDFQNQFGYTFNCGYELKKYLGVFAEVYGDKIIINNIGMVHNMDGGVWYRFNPTFQIDAQAGFGWNSDYYFVMIGFSKLILN
jgi:hypothetical protein